MRDVAQLFRLLADEARLEMLWLLSDHSEPCVCDRTAAPEIVAQRLGRGLHRPQGGEA